ncbi:hypothetical protein CFP56_035114 [Quercus suber]|uniref:Uncharacterized protein n=1 Tax=Quercus suber TaxID=58331 RepID=A0AAW0JAV8_QUESU
MRDNKSLGSFCLDTKTGASTITQSDEECHLDTLSCNSQSIVNLANSRMVVFNGIGRSFSLFYGTSKANFKSFANIAYALVTLSVFMSSRFLCKEKPVKPMVPGGCHLLVSIVVYAISQALE